MVYDPKPEALEPSEVFSFGIEYHHIHHFDIRVPGYRLPRCDAEGEVQSQ